MLRIICVLFFVIFASPAFAFPVPPVFENAQNATPCAVDGYAAEMLQIPGKPLEKGASTIIVSNESESLRSSLRSVEFATGIERGSQVCEFVYHYRLRNIGKEDVFVYWRLNRYVPQLFFLPVGVEEHVIFRFSGQPTFVGKESKVFVKFGNVKKDDLGLVEIIGVTPDKEKKLWKRAIGVTAEIFTPKELSHD